MGWVVNTTSRPLYPQERKPVPIVQEVGWVSGPVWMGAENMSSIGIRSPRPSSPKQVAIPTALSRPTVAPVQYDKQKRKSLNPVARSATDMGNAIKLGKKLDVGQE